MSTTATPRPPAVTGYVSPYPTVVTVTIAHHSASAKSWILAPGACRSNASSIAEQTRTIAITDSSTKCRP